MPNAAFVPFFEHVEAAVQAVTENTFVPVTTPAPAASALVAHDPPPAVAHDPVVSLEREGDRIRLIRIQCSCGQVIELDCVY